MLPMQSIGQAATTFVGQNLGARDVKRARKGTNVALGLSTIISLTMAAILWILAPQFIQLFSRDPKVLEYGVLFLRLCPISNTLSRSTSRRVSPLRPTRQLLLSYW